MSDGPDWAETLGAIKRPPGQGGGQNQRLGMDQVQAWQEFQRERTGADVAVAVGGVDTGDNFDGWGFVTNWAANVGGGLQNFAKMVTGINFAQPPAAVWSDIVNAFVSPLDKFAELVGGLINSIQVPILDPTKVLNLPGLFTNVTAIATNIFNGWFGSGGTGTPTEVRTTIEAIKVAVSNGYTLQTVTVNGSFTVPAGITELNAIVIGGGGNGASGTTGSGTQNGGNGGVGGAYVFKQLDLSVLTPGTAVLTCTVGAGGSGSGGAGSSSTVKDSGGATLLDSAAGTGGVALPQGMMSTSSTAGSGGRGGNAVQSGSPTATAGANGTSSGTANGGTGGNPTVSAAAGGVQGGDGTAGGAGQTSTIPLVGGAGGAGGGGCATNSNFTSPSGGAGGNGGFPGGGGGGSGAGAGLLNIFTRAYGLGANGVIAFLYK